MCTSGVPTNDEFVCVFALTATRQAGTEDETKSSDTIS